MRLVTALAHAYDVIEMCAPAAPRIRLPIPNPKPNPKTHHNPNPININFLSLFVFFFSFLCCLSLVSYDRKLVEKIIHR